MTEPEQPRGHQLDELFAEARARRMDMSAAEYAFETRLLARLRESHHLAMIFISHDLAVVAQACNQPGGAVAVMQYGRLVEHAPAQEIFHAPQHPYTRLLVGSAPTLAGGAADRDRRVQLRAQLSALENSRPNP